MIVYSLITMRFGSNLGDLRSNFVLDRLLMDLNICKFEEGNYAVNGILLARFFGRFNSNSC